MKYNKVIEDQIYSLLDRELGQENFAPGTDRLVIAYKGILQKISESNTRVVTIGGTNGKGECAFSLAHLLRERGVKASLWSSPHILSIRERFFFDGSYIEYEELQSLISETIDELRQIEVKLTYYEFLFYIYLKFSFRRSPEVMILEVGLGGRFDAVNLLEPSVCAITSISRDHQAILGNSYRSILNEKLGITRPGVPLITNLELKFCRNLTLCYTSSGGTPTFDLRECSGFIPENNYSYQNQFLAASLCYYLVDQSDNCINSVSQFASEVLEKVEFPPLKGRLEKMTLGKRTFIFIGAHNVDGMRKMVDRFKGRAEKFDQLLVAFSKRPLADVKASLSILSQSEIAKNNNLTVFSHAKANAEEYDFDLFDFDRVEKWQDFISRELKSSDSILVVGSYYFIGEVQKYLENI